MKIAVINEVSAQSRNPDIIQALEGRSIDVLNVGMTSKTGEQELTYIHTGLMSAILLNINACEMVIGGCGTGQGYLNAAMMYPNVFAGLINDPLDAWLFSQINGGNCVSLALNKGYGWAAEKNLEFIFDRLFQDPAGRGFPQTRQESQRASRKTLMEISRVSHLPLTDILTKIDKEILMTISKSKKFMDLLEESCQKNRIALTIMEKLQ